MPSHKKELKRARTATARAAAHKNRAEARGGDGVVGSTQDPPEDDDDYLHVVKVRAKTPEPVHKKDFECLRCVLSALHGHSSGWCVPATGRSKKCRRCADGRTPCVLIREGSELRRLAGEFLAAKRGNVAYSRLSRATNALRSRVAFEGTLVAGDPRISTQKCDEVDAGGPPSQQPSGWPGDIAPNQTVDAASLGGSASSRTVAVANENQINALRAAIDGLVVSSLPEAQLAAHRILMDQYVALLTGRERWF
ncbi:hypothetical protein CGRA01v4_09930 [Colletotrichum graminicola]|nr:hypothetical protein CGRA01v4_09930 [Colletotrichum graminicola]